jgi:c-di-AMP phosphodiesterase-like protein
MNYFNFIISDKKTIQYWIFIFLVICLFSILFSFINNDFLIFIWSFPLFVLVFYIGYYSHSYFYYTRYYIYHKRLKNRGLKFENGVCKVEIFQESFSMKPIKQNHDAWINIAPKIVETNYLKTNDMLILFYPTFNFGYFKSIFLRH